MDVVGAWPVDTVSLISADSGLAQPSTTSDIPERDTDQPMQSQNITPRLHPFKCSYLQFPLTFCLTFLHMVDSRPGRWSLGFSWLQSVMGKDVLSNGSAHLGSPSERQAQHLIPVAAGSKHFVYYLCRYDERSRDYQSCCCNIFLTFSFFGRGLK